LRTGGGRIAMPLVQFAAMSSLRALSCALVLAAAACSGARSTSSDSASQAVQPPQVGTAPPVAIRPPDAREAKLAAAITKLLEEDHLRRRRIDDAVSKAAFAIYLERLDPGKMFLLKGDAAVLAKSADQIDDQLHAGRLALAHEGAALYAARLDLVKGWVAELLAAPFDASNEEWVELDPDKLELAATDAELRERWRQRLELEVLERVALMEDRLAAAQKAQAQNDKKPDKKAGKKTPAVAKNDKQKVPGAASSDGPSASAAPAPEPDDDDPAPFLRTDQIPPTPEGREAKARADLATSYQARFTRLASPDALDAAADLVNAVAAAFDPHTDYLPPSDKANFDIQMTGSVEGIGAVLREDDHYIRVVEVVPGGASWRDGKLEAGDLILSVKQEGAEPVDVADMRIDEVVKMVRGPRGTTVTLNIQKATGEILTLAIKRDVVVIEAAYARGAVLRGQKAGKPTGKEVGYIYLPSFYGGRGPGQRSAAADVARLLTEMQKRKLGGVILDLRSNGGGLLGDAVEMTGLLVDKGPVVQTQQSDGAKEVLSDDDPGIAFGGEMIVMVDRFSASASEIVAGALQDYKRALVVGTGHTHGKGTVQVVADLDRLTGGKDNLGSFKITVQQFFRVSGASTQWQGVVPDITLPDPAGHIDSGERELDNSIPYSAIEPLPHQDWTPSWNVEALTQKSTARVAKDDVLPKLAARTEMLRLRQTATKVPLQKTAWVTQRDQQRAQLEATSPDLEDSPARFTVTMLEKESTVAAGGSGKTDDRISRWRETLSHDPWVGEALALLGDMTTK
jgi:carboxyl-terminal processing protease